MLMPFGEFKGRPLAALDEIYLKQLLNDKKLGKSLRRAIEIELPFKAAERELRHWEVRHRKPDPPTPRPPELEPAFALIREIGIAAARASGDVKLEMIDAAVDWFNTNTPFKKVKP